MSSEHFFFWNLQSSFASVFQIAAKVFLFFGRGVIQHQARLANTGSWLRIFGFVLYVKTVSFLEQLQVHSKIAWKVQIFPIYSLSPHMHSLSHYQHPLQSGTLVTTDEHTLTHHNHPEAIVYFRVYSWSYILYGFGHMCNDRYALLYHHTMDQFHILPKIKQASQKHTYTYTQYSFSKN